jgi:hypothetical protein
MYRNENETFSSSEFPTSGEKEACKEESREERGGMWLGNVHTLTEARLHEVSEIKVRGESMKVQTKVNLKSIKFNLFEIHSNRTPIHSSSLLSSLFFPIGFLKFAARSLTFGISSSSFKVTSALTSSDSALKWCMTCSWNFIS